MKVALISTFLVCLASLSTGETINSLSTHTNSCLFCGMVEGVGYLTAKVRAEANDSEYQGLNDYFRFVAAQTAACQGASMMTVMLTGFQDRLTLSPERGL